MRLSYYVRRTCYNYFHHKPKNPLDLHILLLQLLHFSRLSADLSAFDPYTLSCLTNTEKLAIIDRMGEALGIPKDLPDELPYMDHWDGLVNDLNRKDCTP